MALVLNGSANTIGGLAVGGVPDGTIDADALAANAVTTAKINDLNVTAGKLASGVGGKLLQLQSSSIDNQTSATGWGIGNAVDTGLATTITPSSTSNKVLIHWTGVIRGNGSDYVSMACKIDGQADYLAITDGGDDDYVFYASATHSSPGAWSYLHSPNSTSALTYRIFIVGYASSGTAYHVGTNNYDVCTLNLWEVAA